ncbi:MAG: hypothetical protein PUE01_11660 [Clostridiaceae bacterium]|nr:hypothetical protein [Clostridiaceae bacterium]
MNNDFLLPLLLPGGIGLIIFIIGIIVAIKEVNKGKQCTSCVIGHVVDYILNEEKLRIIVEYNVNGVMYRGKKMFKGINIHTRRRSINDLNPHNYDIYIDDKDVLHIDRGILMNYKEAMRKVCPVGTPYKVYYNPMKPQQSFVDREPYASPVYGILLMVVGFILMVVGGAISFAFA